MADTEARWYVAHTYSGYENKVKADIENTIVNRNLQDQILEVYVPMQEVEREGKDKKKLVQQKMFPAYVLIKMFMNDDTWYVRNTRGVTGFVGPGSKPVPLTDEEVASMGLMSSVAEAPFSIGDSVIVKCIEIDDQGRINLSRRDALIELEGMTPENEIDETPRKPRRDNHRRDNNRK